MFFILITYFIYTNNIFIIILYIYIYTQNLIYKDALIFVFQITKNFSFQFPSFFLNKKYNIKIKYSNKYLIKSKI